MHIIRWQDSIPPQEHDLRMRMQQEDFRLTRGRMAPATLKQPIFTAIRRCSIVFMAQQEFFIEWLSKELKPDSRALTGYKALGIAIDALKSVSAIATTH